MSMLPISIVTRNTRNIAAMAMVAVGTSTATAQGPALPMDASPPPAERPAMDGAMLLAANVARLIAASAPPPTAALPVSPSTAWNVSAHAFRDSILVSVVRTAVGTRYARGGQSIEQGFDCSGLVRYVMAALEIEVPRTAARQAASGIALGTDTARLLPGDLLTFGRGTRGISHIGIYVGNGRYVHASSVAGRVIESALARNRPRRGTTWRDTRRVGPIADADSSVIGAS